MAVGGYDGYCSGSGYKKESCNTQSCKEGSTVILNRNGGGFIGEGKEIVGGSVGSMGGHVSGSSGGVAGNVAGSEGSLGENGSGYVGGSKGSSYRNST